MVFFFESPHVKRLLKATCEKENYLAARTFFIYSLALYFLPIQKHIPRVEPDFLFHQIIKPLPQALTTLRKSLKTLWNKEKCC